MNDFPLLLESINDFKGIFPQFTPDNKAQMAISHKVVLMDPHTAKEFVKMLSDNIKNYEKKFGKIKTPSEIKKAKSDMKKDNKKNSKKDKDDSKKKLSYMG